RILLGFNKFCSMMITAVSRGYKSLFPWIIYFFLPYYEVSMYLSGLRLILSILKWRFFTCQPAEVSFFGNSLIKLSDSPKPCTPHVRMASRIPTMTQSHFHEHSRHGSIRH